MNELFSPDGLASRVFTTECLSQNNGSCIFIEIALDNCFGLQAKNTLWL